MSNDSSSAASAKPAAKVKNPYRAWPWGPSAAVVMAAVSFVASQLLVGGLAAIGLGLAGWSGGRIEDWFGSIAGQFILVLCSEVLTITILWWFIVKRRKADWRILGYLRRPAVKDVFLALGAFVIYFTLLLLAVGLAKALFNIDTDQKQELGFDNVAGANQKVLAFISLVVLPPIVEETIFRGFLFTGLRKKLNFVWATLATSLLFAAPHLLESSSGPLWIAGLDTLVMSFVLCYLREKTGALWAGIGVHFLKNGLAFLALYIFVSQ